MWGGVVTREELIALLWGESHLIHEQELDRLVEGLTRKLGEPPAFPGVIVGTPGVGSLLNPRGS